jgi:hypothetical protein
MTQDTGSQLDMFENSPKKDWLTERKPKFSLTFVKDLQDLPIIAKPVRVVRLNPTTVIIWND